MLQIQELFYSSVIPLNIQSVTPPGDFYSQKLFLKAKSLTDLNKFEYFILPS